ncbi:uncharacterized protein LOC122854706 isoform X2 [Aphidius gifuensis]|uniref:uncharacterized protein LOC122854706 isoform X2 n=1 Tax=Aphidius gifuensis TaxID=684658 RepID=UPI001CDB5677|nr:uncharacterized protein LOC122854706 isoform X2 [Aphidius gifuensis]
MKYFTRSYKREKLLELKKTCVKKSKVTSNISTCPFNKKNDKKYYQHYVDDAKNTRIDLVNDDCLAEIFMYLSACERPKIALVCKKWKRALDYAWQNVKKLELIHWEYNECPSYLKKYPKINDQVRFLKSLLDKCGRYLTELDLTAHGYCGIVRVINESCPNLVKLRLRFKYIEPEILVNAFSRLSKLKVLKIIFQILDDDGYIPDTLINSLRSIAGTLTELTLSNWNEEYLYTNLRIPQLFIHIIPELKVLKLIETAGILIDTDLYMHLQHFGISVISHDSELFDHKINDNILPYEKVKTLHLKDFEATDDCLYTIANCMKNLMGLTTKCKRITDTGIVTISKINNLIFLILGGTSQVTDSSVKLLKNLKYLHLPYSNKITDDSVMKILENSPEIKNFYAVETAITFEFIKKAAKLASIRKKKLDLGISIKPGLKQYESRYLKLTLFNSSIDIVYKSKKLNNSKRTKKIT